MNDDSAGNGPANGSGASNDRAGRIRELNDAMRKNLAGRVLATIGVRALGTWRLLKVLEAVRDFDAFDRGNDPYGEHDFGTFELFGEQLIWKMDYYDRALSGGSPDPADPEVTTRVLTVMLAEEY